MIRNFYFLHEICLYETALNKLLKLGHNSDMIATSAMNYYNFNKSSVCVLILDASKAFDKVHYCKLFNELLKRDISPFILRLFVYMYTGQTLRVKNKNKNDFIS